MPSSPQHPAPTPRDISDADAEDLALHREKFRRRLPESLDELRGPTHGVVDLPLHVAWSGMTAYDLSKLRQRMGLYRTVLHEDLHDDLPQYLNQDLLLQLWPVLRTLVGRTVRAVWEDASPPSSPPDPGQPRDGHAGAAHAAAGGCDRARFPVSTGSHRWIRRAGAHRLVNRPSQDLDVATENPAPMADIAATLRAGLKARGWKVPQTTPVILKAAQNSGFSSAC